MNELHRQQDENEEQFLWRLGQMKDKGIFDLSWSDIADIMNQECKEDESDYLGDVAYRKPYQQAKKFFEAGVFNKLSEDSYLDELSKAKHEIKIEKQKLLDERTSLNKVLREQGRMESMFDVVKRAIDEYEPVRFEYIPHIGVDSDNDLIIHFTDPHCGITIDSPLNTYNSGILRQRVQKYLDAVINIQQTYNSQNAYVILGGDMIQGLIHTNARIEAKEDVVSQIMIITDVVSNFLYELSKVFQNVEVHSVAGNHARSTASKEESVQKENFDLLIPFACKKDLKDIENIRFIDNYLDCDIATFSVRGWMVYATHGDKDSASTVVSNMIGFARKAKLKLPDICYLGHRHTNGLTTVDDVKVIESGCVGGMDSYAIGKRLIGSPEQTVTVVTESQRIKALCDIQL